MSDRIADIRRRKMDLYRQLLPAKFTGKVSAEPLDDLGYLAALAEIEVIAPPSLAFEIGAQRSLADLGLIGRLILSAPTLADTLSIWRSHAGMGGELAEMDSVIRGEGARARWVITFIPAPYLSPRLARFVLEELTTMFFKFTREVCGSELRDFRTELPYERRAGVEYRRYFPGPVAFASPVARISGPAAVLDLPQVARDRETFDLLSRGVAADQRVEQGALRQRLSAYFLAHPRQAPKLADAARALGMSARTLDRRLTAEGANYAACLRGFRLSWARELLRSRTISLAETASLLGYSNENSFRRAFKAWTGIPAGRWRRQN